MRINHNIASLNSYRQLTSNAGAQNKSLEKLSSGMRINRAGDDAAGLAISEKMRGQIRGLEQASRNAQDGISLIQTAEGGLNETHSILQRMRELAVQGASDTLTSNDRTSISTEITKLVEEINNIASNTKFNTKSLLNGTLGSKIMATTITASAIMGVSTATGVAGAVDVAGAQAGVYNISGTTAGIITLISSATGYSVKLSAVTSGAQTLDFGTMGIKIKLDANFALSAMTAAYWDGASITVSGTSATFQIGADQNQTVSIAIGDMQASALSVNALDLGTNSSAAAAITTIDAAVVTVSTARANLGAYQNRLEHTINNLGTAAENLTASESRIRDVDMAKEMMEFTKNNILQQAATAMLAQANQQPQGVLQLLR